MGEVLKESLHMFHAKNNKSMNNAISYVVPKNKTISYSMRLNSKISCVVIISIFGFKKYWQTVFNFMELDMSPTFKQLLNARTIDSNKNKSYNKWYNVKMRAFHKKAMTKQQIYENIIAGWTGVDYSQIIHFGESLINMNKAAVLARGK